LFLIVQHGSVAENEHGLVEEVTTTVCDNNAETICYLPMDTTLQSTQSTMFMKTENSSLMDNLISFTQSSGQTTREFNIHNCCQMDHLSHSHRVKHTQQLSDGPSFTQSPSCCMAPLTLTTGRYERLIAETQYCQWIFISSYCAIIILLQRSWTQSLRLRVKMSKSQQKTSQHLLL